MGLRGKLLAVGLLIVVSMTILAGWATYNINQSSKTLLSFKRSVDDLETFFSLEASFSKISHAYNTAIIKLMMGNGSDIKIDELTDSVSKIDKLAETYEQFENEKTSRIAKNLVRLKEPLKTGLEAIKKNDSYGASEILSTKIQTPTALVNDDTESLVNETKAKVDDDHKSFVAMSQRTMTIFLVASICMILLAVGLLARFGSIARPLEQVSDMLSHVAESLAQSSASLVEQADSAHRSAENQSKSISQTVSASAEIGANLKSNLSSAVTMRDVAKDMAASFQLAQVSIGALTDSMGRLVQGENQIQEISELIKVIAEKTNVIHEIVFKTQMLAFNASVEAARAGEHGRGFSIVAQEIGKLATLSGEAASEIEATVKQGIERVGRLLDENKTNVASTSNKTVELAHFLNDLDTRASSLAHHSNSVFESSNEQTAGLQTITTSIERIQEETQLNLASVEQTAKTGENLDSQARSVNELSQKLHTIVNG